MSGIKYRVWNMRRWLNDNEVSITPSGKILVLDRDEEIWRENVHYDLKVVRYAGLKDRNGIEMYEGDALCASGNLDGEEFVGFIDWDEDDARFEVVSLHGRYEYIPSGCYVKGNKYETPELLEGIRE